MTKKAAFRTVSDWDQWWQKDRRFVDEGTPGSYGGYYSLEDIHAVLNHATRLGITVIPEIELPGHSNEIFAAYPELSCLNEWAFENSDVCIGNEKTSSSLKISSTKSWRSSPRSTSTSVATKLR